MLEASVVPSVILGISIIFSALLLGYFVVLRESVRQEGRTREAAARAAKVAEADLAYLSSLSSFDLAIADLDEKDIETGLAYLIEKNYPEA